LERRKKPLSLPEFETWIPACNVVVAFTTKRYLLGMDFQVFIAVFVKIVNGVLFYPQVMSLLFLDHSASQQVARHSLLF
jgi:hypothetical protein